MESKLLISGLVGFFALVNPIHKVSVINSLQGQFSTKELKFLSIKSSITAFVILVFFLFLGELIFNNVFHVELYAFQITCGLVLTYTGLSGLQKGEFLTISKTIKLVDLANVPVAIPMIAGPATITAAVTFPANYGNLILEEAIKMAEKKAYEHLLAILLDVNFKSKSLSEKFGFSIVGHLKKIAKFKNGNCGQFIMLKDI